jgi:hypothetical protein
MVPRMPELGEPCTLQKYTYVPGLVNVNEYVCGAATGWPLLANAGGPAEVTSWKPPTHVQVTVVPTLMVTLAGSNRLPPSFRS